MNQNTQDTSVQSSEQSAQTSNEQEVEVNRSPEDYARRLQEVSSEARNWRKKNSELKARLDEIEKSKLESEGKKDELIERLKKEAQTKEESLKQATQKYAYQVISSKIIEKAVNAGCVDTEALLALSDLNTLEIDDNLSVDEKSVEHMINEAQKKRPYLFQQKKPLPKDGIPAKNMPEMLPGKGMSIDDIAKKIAELGRS